MLNDVKKLAMIYENSILNGSNKTFDDLVKENTFIFSGGTSEGLLYHATSIQAVYSILHGGGFTTNSHGVTNESQTISTSINDNITQYFSSDEHKCMFIFNFIKSKLPVFVLPKWLHSIHTDIEFDVDREFALEKAREYNIPIGRFWEIPEDFLANNLDAKTTAFTQQYVYEQYLKTGRHPPLNDESEITFFQEGTPMLFDAISYIVLDGEDFADAQSCLEYLTSNYDEEYLTKPVRTTY